MTFRADHPDRLAISHSLLLIQQKHQDNEPPLQGYDPEEVLISGPELLLLVMGLSIQDGGRLSIVGKPQRPWYEPTDRSFACIAPMLEGSLRILDEPNRILDEPNDREWAWTIKEGVLRETALHIDAHKVSIIRPFD